MHKRFPNSFVIFFIISDDACFVSDKTGSSMFFFELIFACVCACEYGTERLENAFQSNAWQLARQREEQCSDLSIFMVEYLLCRCSLCPFSYFGISWIRRTRERAKEPNNLFPISLLDRSSIIQLPTRLFVHRMCVRGRAVCVLVFREVNGMIELMLCKEMRLKWSKKKKQTNSRMDCARVYDKDFVVDVDISFHLWK